MLTRIKTFLLNLFSGEQRRLRRLWASALDEEVKLNSDLSNLKEHAQASLQRWFSNPEVIRKVLEELREHKPILVTRNFAVVTRYSDVIEVLSHDEDFTVKQIYAAKMERTSGSFFLGMDRGEQYEGEHAKLQMAIHPKEDVPRIRKFVSENADMLIDQAKRNGRIDVVNGLFRLVATRLVEHYFGVPGPDEATMMKWHRTIFRDIFLNLNNAPEVMKEAAVSAEEMNKYMDELIARRKAELAAGDDGRDDVLTRLLKMQRDPEHSFDDAGICRNVGGTILGAIETTSKAATQAFDQLLNRPELLRVAQEATLADNDQLVFSCVFEALRFNPHNPIIIRHCNRSYTLAKGTKREKEIPQGSTVFAATLAAMFDPEEFPSPNEFRTDRPAGKYIHFGYGLHTCFGEYLNVAQVPVAIKRLLRQQGLRRAAGDDGQMRFDGPFPDRLIVAFDA